MSLLVGESAADRDSAGRVDEDTIVQPAQTLGAGYLGRERKSVV